MSLSSRAVQAGRPRQQKMTIVILGGIFHDLGDETSWKKRSMNLNAKGNTLRLIGIFIGSQFSLHILSAVVSLDSVISGKIPNCWCFFQAAHSRKTGRLICPLGLVVDNSTTNNRSVNTHSCWNNVIHEWKLPFLTSQDLQLMMINLFSDPPLHSNDKFWPIYAPAQLDNGSNWLCQVWAQQYCWPKTLRYFLTPADAKRMFALDPKRISFEHTNNHLYLHLFYASWHFV